MRGCGSLALDQKEMDAYETNPTGPREVVPEQFYADRHDDVRKENGEMRWFKPCGHDRQGQEELSPFCEGEPYTRSVIEAMIPSTFRLERVASMREPLTRKNAGMHYSDDRSDQKASRSRGGGAFGYALQRAMSLRDEGKDQKKASDKQKLRQEVMQEERLLGKEGGETVLEEAVRRALSSKDCGKAYGGLQRSLSVRENGSRKTEVWRDELPSTLIIKRSHGRRKSLEEEAFGSVKMEDRRRKLEKEDVQISPREQKWEEAEEEEEARRGRGRLHSQSMRCPVNKVTEEATELFPEEEEWAVYAKSGYISVRPKAERRGGGGGGMAAAAAVMRDPAVALDRKSVV